ncbi:MAG: ribosomal-processing cysteine protease Prp [Clostridia bacterium]|nr:ribosomal-processing cysteine protease Prp [Clostridia bacterium]
MTRVKFLSKSESLYGFEILGHSSVDCNDDEGKIVCAAVSSASYLAANTIIEIIGDKCDAEVDDAKMSVCVKNPSDKTIAVLEGLKLHLTELSKQYSKRIKITTEV